MVEGWTEKSLATSLFDFPALTMFVASSICSSLRLLGRPPTRPRLLAASRPAVVLSRSTDRSNSANAPIICIIIRPPGVVVSIGSVRHTNPAATSSSFFIMRRRSCRDRLRRSSFQTMTTSPSRRWSIIVWNSGRSHRPPDAFSTKILSAPASRRASI